MLRSAGLRLGQAAVPRIGGAQRSSGFMVFAGNSMGNTKGGTRRCAISPVKRGGAGGLTHLQLRALLGGLWQQGSASYALWRSLIILRVRCQDATDVREILPGVLLVNPGRTLSATP